MRIYKITNLINGKIYIGQTTYSLKARFTCHKHHIAGKSLMTDAIKKYGRENFTIEEIEVCKNQKALNKAESKWIAFYDCIAPKGYNIKRGANGKKKIGGAYEADANAEIPDRFCLGCGQSINHKIQQAKYCSLACKRKLRYHSKPNAEFVCKNCGEKFQCRVRGKETRKNCGNKCSALSRRKQERVGIICEYCKNTFTASYKAKYCSRKCFGMSSRKRIEIICEYCKNTFTIKFCLSITRKYCSHKCYGLAQRGKKKVGKNLLTLEK